MAVRTYTGTDGATIGALGIGATTMVGEGVGGANAKFLAPGADGSGTCGSYHGAVYAETDVTDATEAWFQGKLCVPAKPLNGCIALAGANNAGNTRVQVNVSTSDGTLRLRDDSGELATTALDVTGGTWWNVWGHWTIGGAYELIVYSDVEHVYEPISGVSSSGGVFSLWREGCTDTDASTEIRWDDTEWSTTEIPRPPVPVWREDNAIVGHPRDNSFSVSLTTSGVSDVRLKIPGGPGGTDRLSDPVPVTSFSTTIVRIDGLTPNTSYTWQAQGLDSTSTWVDLGEPGTARTLPVAGVPNGTHKIALSCCEFPAYDTRAAWDDMLAWAPHYWAQLGDWVYYNNFTTDLELRRRAILNQLLSKPGQADAARLLTLLARCDSDHDRMNNSVFHGAFIDVHIRALAQTTPLPPTPAWITDSPGSMYSVLFGRWLIIVTDDRTNNMGPGLNRLDEGGTANDQYWGAEQEAWIYQQMRRALPGGDAAFIILLKDQPIVGDNPDDVKPKPDHGACYPAVMTRLGQVMYELDAANGRLSGWVGTFDYHGLACWRHLQHANLPWPGKAGGGTANDSGNIRANDEHNYAVTFGAESEHADGWPIAVYDRLTLSDDGTNMTLFWEGWDALTGQRAKPEMTETINITVPYTPEPPTAPMRAAVRPAWSAQLLPVGG